MKIDNDSYHVAKLTKLVVGADGFA